MFEENWGAVLVGPLDGDRQGLLVLGVDGGVSSTGLQMRFVLIRPSRPDQVLDDVMQSVLVVKAASGADVDAERDVDLRRRGSATVGANGV